MGGRILELHLTGLMKLIHSWNISDLQPYPIFPDGCPIINEQK